MGDLCSACHYWREPAVFQLLRAFAQNPRRLSQGPTNLRRSFQKVPEPWDRRSWTRPHAHVGQCLSGSASISACMAWIALVVLHTIGHLAPPEEQNSIDPLSPNTYRRDAPKPYRIIPPGASTPCRMNFSAYCVSIFEASSLASHVL
jgi:hypothetical protein